MNNAKENKMAVMPVGKLLVTMSLPMMFSMLVQALYNIVDSIFIAKIGENALAAVSLSFPVQVLIIAVAVGTGVGMNSLISRRLGEKDYEAANAAATNGILLGIASSLVFAVFGLFFARMFFEAFTDNQIIIDLGTQYTSICTIFSFGVFLQIAAERIMLATGNAVYSMVIQCIGAVINIIFDPILIFGLFGFPAMGVSGAAVATVLGQIIAMIIALWLNKRKNKHIHLSFKKYKASLSIIKEIYIVGFPSIIMQAIMSFMVIGMNKILIPFSEAAVSIMGVYFKLQNFIFMPVLGMSNALITIVGFNYGAKDKGRIMHTIRLALITSVSIMAVGTIIFRLFPQQLLYLFNPSEEMLRLGTGALKIISISFIFAGVSIVFSSVFQAVGNGLYSMLMSLFRQMVIILPVAYILANLFSIQAVWFAFPISELVTLLLCLALFRNIYQKQIKYL